MNKLNYCMIKMESADVGLHRCGCGEIGNRERERETGSAILISSLSLTN